MSLYIKTPLIDRLPFEEAPQKVSFKMEAYQPSGSFKLRGIEYLTREVLKKGVTHLVSSSGGNAGLSAAYVGRQLGIRVSVVVPVTTPAFIVEKLRQEGARVTVHGEAWDEAHELALTMTRSKDTALIPPFDHPLLWEGHASMVDELKEDLAGPPDLVIVSVGGGGLLNGVVEGLKRNHWTDTAILAVETRGAASFYESVKQHRLVTLEKIDTLATSLGAKTVSQKALQNAMDYPIIPHLVTDQAAVNACLRFADEYRTLVEPACGASLSVVFDESPVLRNYQRIVVIVCGGAIVNLEKLQAWREKSL
ncbi:MAG: hypothetical protein AVO33_01920 [delta proteobacterium ML8_F1]|nr:MAG: hypothetical protein AVO33_01920 [delta proteobacterium ML8_F1]